QAELALSAAKFRTMAEAMPQIIWTANPDGERDYFNRRWFDCTGMSEEQSLRWGWTEGLHPDDVSRVTDRWIDAYTSGKPFEVEYRLKCGSPGEYRWYLSRALPIRDDAGKIVKWVGSVNDIHEQRLLVERLETERGLRERFVNTLSHDLRT